MDNKYSDHEQVRLSDIVRRGIATADANIGFIIIFFVVYFATWFGMTRVSGHFVGSGTVAEADTPRLIVMELYFRAALVPIDAVVYSLIGAILRRQLVSPQSGGPVSLLAWGRKFFPRMLLIAAIQTILLFPLDTLFYVPLIYVAAFVIWQDCSFRKAYSGTMSFLSTHSGKFFPVWFLGMAFLLWVNAIPFVPASMNPVFAGLVSLVCTYFDFAMLATALVFYLALQPKREEVLA